MISMPTWMGLPVGEETKHTTWWADWDGYYLAECPHGCWSVWDANLIVPLCECRE